MYGSNFWIWTDSPRERSSRPIEAAAMPLPSEETTPPVMKIKRVSAWLIARSLLPYSPISEGTVRGGRTRLTRRPASAP